MGEVYLDSRRTFLRRSQNPDGGWGYFPAKQSWMEPTVYALLALQGVGEYERESARAWRLIESWQRPDGSWRAGAEVPESTWVTALGVLLCSGRKDGLEAAKRGIHWLQGTSGAESRWTVRLASRLGMLKTGLDVRHPGWPWWPGNSAWIEPTALTVLALKKWLALQPGHGREAGGVEDRMREGERAILTRRDHDGGWNSGNPNVLKFDLPSYPESTALALLGLQGMPPSDWNGPLEVARGYYRDCKSPLARAWLNIALRCYGENPPIARQPAPEEGDVLLTALEAIGHPGGNLACFQLEGRS